MSAPVLRPGRPDEAAEMLEVMAAALAAEATSGAIVLKLETADKIDPYGGTMAVGSSLAMAAYCDALVWGVLELKGTSREEFVRHHPGGIVSRL